MGQRCYPSKSWVFKSRVFFSKSEATLYPTESMLNSLQNGMCSFIIRILLVYTITISVSTKNPPSSSVNIYLPIPPLLVHKIILTIRTNTPFLYTSAIFHLRIFAYNHPNNLNKKYFPYLSHLANPSCVKGPQS